MAILKLVFRLFYNSLTSEIYKHLKFRIAELTLLKYTGKCLKYDLNS